MGERGGEGGKVRVRGGEAGRQGKGREGGAPQIAAFQKGQARGDASWQPADRARVGGRCPAGAGLAALVWRARRTAGSPPLDWRQEPPNPDAPSVATNCYLPRLPSGVPPPQITPECTQCDLRRSKTDRGEAKGEERISNHWFLG